MRRKKEWFQCFALCLILQGTVLAMEIPLEGGGKKTKVATVDMHKIFEAFPETERARMDLNKMIEKKKRAITEKKEEIAKLKAEIDLLKKPTLQTSTATASLLPGTTASLTVPTSTSTAPTAVLLSTTGTPTLSVAVTTTTADSKIKDKELKEKEALLLSKEAELGVFVGISQEEIDSLEQGKTMGLLARIYQILGKIAAEEGYSIVMSKDDILYGEGTIDLTQTVISKLELEYPKRK
ncbi:MAG: OmpH family outer membrane protein [Elusimicrobia bacterium]|nr:OmpH family outer membrane protein [Elusimicrobiota bacterium]